MLQLNNIISGEIIRYQKSKDSGIYYKIYENSFIIDDKKCIDKRCDYFDENVELDKSLFEGNTVSLNDVKHYQTLLKIQESEPDFILSEDERNWFITTGSTGLETLFRLFIPNKAYDNALRDKDKDGSVGEMGEYYPLWQVISYGTAYIDSKFSQITDNSIVLYLEELNEQHRAVINMYAKDNVIVEDKYPVNPMI